MSESLFDPNEPIRVATFAVGDELLAMDIMRIREIVRPLPITPVPKAPFAMVGVIDLRGEVLPLFDLRQRFDIAEPLPMSHPTVRFLIVRVLGRSVGLVVDAVFDVLTVTRQQLRVGPSVLAGDAALYFVGVCPVGDRLALLVNIRRLLEGTERVDLSGLAVASGERALAAGDGVRRADHE